MVYLTRKAEFAASHYYHNPDFTPEENRRIFGKCNNTNGHGHNYTLEVTVIGAVDEATGMVCNLVDLDGFVQREVLDRFHLENLNTRPEFSRAVPTTENLCTTIYDILQRGFSHAHLERVRIEETMM